LRSGNAALAVEELDRLARQQPDNARAALLLGRALLAAGDSSELLARLEPAAKRPDASPYLLTLVGRAHEQAGRRAEAARYLDRAAAGGQAAIGALPVGEAGELAMWRARDELDSAGAAVPLLRQMLAQGQFAAATAFGAQLGAHYRGSGDVERLRGDVALLAGDAAAALASYERAAAIRRDLALVERMVAAQRRLGHDAAALALLANHVRQNPRDGRAQAMLGRMQAKRGQWQQAAVLLRGALRLGAGSGDPLLLADLATAELTIGDADAASAAARRAYALQKGNGRVAAVLARTLQAAEPRQAEVLLAKARRLPDPPQLARR